MHYPTSHWTQDELNYLATEVNIVILLNFREHICVAT